jgi:ribonuclease PH
MQGAGEEATFTQSDLTALIELGKTGINRLITLQRELLKSAIPDIPEL